MNSYFDGFALGLLAVLFIALLVRVFIQRRLLRQNCKEYDERQLAVQGTAYKLSYFVLIIALVAGGLLTSRGETPLCSPFTVIMLCIIASLAVFVTICILKDAYFTAKSRRPLMVILFLILGAVNLFFGIRSLVSGSAESGIVSSAAGGILVYCCLLILGKQIYEKRQGDE